MGRKSLGIALAALAFLAPAASADIAIVGAPGSAFPYQRWADEAKVATPDTQVLLLEGSESEPTWPCFAEYGVVAACAVPDASTVHIAPATVPEPRFTLYHELGHIVDAQVLTSADRGWFANLIRIQPVPWLTPTTHETPGEYFAQAFATCARFGPKIRFAQLELPGGRFAYPRLHARICRFISHAVQI